jgi:hypothetical protein
MPRGSGVAFLVLVLAATLSCTAPGVETGSPAEASTPNASPIDTPDPTAEASGARTIVVAQDGSGDAATIAAGLELAREGDTVLLRAGTYREHVVIDRSIELLGDPAASAVTIEFDTTSPSVQLTDGTTLPNAVLVKDADASLAFLTIRGPARGVALQVAGGAPTLDNVQVVLGGLPSMQHRYAARFTDGSAASWVFSDLGGSLLVDGAASPSLGSVSVDGRVDVRGAGTQPVVRDSRLGEVVIADGALATITVNRIDGTVSVSDTESPEISRNLIDGDPGAVGILVRGASPLIRGNSIRGVGTGIDVGAGAGPTIEANVLEEVSVAVKVGGTAADLSEELLIRGNRFCDITMGVDTPVGADLYLEGNEPCSAGTRTPRPLVAP